MDSPNGGVIFLAKSRSTSWQSPGPVLKSASPGDRPPWTVSGLTPTSGYYRNQSLVVVVVVVATPAAHTLYSGVCRPSSVAAGMRNVWVHVGGAHMQHGERAAAQNVTM